MQWQELDFEEMIASGKGKEAIKFSWEEIVFCRVFVSQSIWQDIWQETFCKRLMPSSQWRNRVTACRTLLSSHFV